MAPRGGSPERVYRWLLRCYPTGFRARFGDEMVQLFGDQLRDARVAGGRTSTAGVSLRTLIDLVITVIAEHARKDRTMGHSITVAPTRTTRALGLLGILGGAWIVAWLLPFIPWGPEGVNLRLMAFNVGAITIIIGLARRLPSSARIGLAVAAGAVLVHTWYLAMTILALDRPVPPEGDADFRLIWFWAGVAMWWADTAFGVVALRFGGLARLGGAAVTVGSVLAFLGMDRLELVVGPYKDVVVPLSLAGITMLGVGWILLGLDLATRRRQVLAGNG